MNSIDKERLNEIDRKIETLMKEKEKINPFANLKSMSNKIFGEVWSEQYILDHVPNFTRYDQKGWDLESPNLGHVEVKSSRLPCKQITFNQCHPDDCDYFLFVEYDVEEVEVYCFLVPSKDFFNFSVSSQHDRENKKCFTLSGSTKNNRKLLEKYKISNWEELNQKAGGTNG